MVEHTLDQAFQALSSPVRRSMLNELAEGERSVTELAAPHEITLAAASKHIKVLERAGMIERTIEGRRHNCRLVHKPLEDTYRWLEDYRRFWSSRLDALEAAMKTDEITERGETPCQKPAR